MKKVILMSIQPQWLEKILNGEKTAEIRTSIPTCDLPVDVYFYCTKGKGSDKNPMLCKAVDFDYDEKTQEFIKGDSEYGLNIWKAFPPCFSILDGKVPAKFTLRFTSKIEYIENCLDFGRTEQYYEICQDELNTMCLTYEELEKYGKGKALYAWHIENLEIFDKPMELSDFKIENKELQELGAFGWVLDNQSNFVSITKASQSWRYVYVEENND